MVFGNLAKQAYVNGLRDHLKASRIELAYKLHFKSGDLSYLTQVEYFAPVLSISDICPLRRTAKNVPKRSLRSTLFDLFIRL